ncbi:hypothetical protein V1289_003201 [Bradyrhizobium sp. AZCC 2289]
MRIAVLAPRPAELIRADAPFCARAVSRHLVRRSPSNGLIRKQIASAFKALGAIAFNGGRRDENERKALTAGKQMGLQLEPAHGRHPDIGYHAGCLIPVRRTQEFFSRRERMDHHVAKRPHEIVDCSENRLIVVDD